MEAYLEVTSTPESRSTTLTYENETTKQTKNSRTRKKRAAASPPLQVSTPKSDHISVSMPDLRLLNRENGHPSIITSSQSMDSGFHSSHSIHIPMPITEHNSLSSSDNDTLIITLTRQASTLIEQAHGAITPDALVKFFESLSGDTELKKATPLTQADTVKVVMKRVVRHAAFGTVGADFAAYLGCATPAWILILALATAGAIEALYKCGKKLDEEQINQEINCVFQAISKAVYKILRNPTESVSGPLMDLLQNTYYASSITGTACTIVADVLAHLTTSLMPSATALTNLFCPAILAMGTTIGALSAIMPKVADYAARSSLANQPEPPVKKSEQWV